MLTAIGLSPGGSSTVHIYTQTMNRTTQLTTLFGGLSGIRTQIGQTKINDKLRKNYRPIGKSASLALSL
jgi:heme O synthase-like polyprenyltransferase